MIDQETIIEWQERVWASDTMLCAQDFIKTALANLADKDWGLLSIERARLDLEIAIDCIRQIEESHNVL